MTLALVLFAIAAVAAAATLLLRLRSPAAGRAVPTWLLVANLGVTVVTLVLAILVEVSGP